MKKVLLLAFVFINSICFGQTGNFTQQFIADSTGTLGFREKSVAFDSAKHLYFINGKNLKALSYDEVIALLGKPNGLVISTFETIIHYSISNSKTKKSELTLGFLKSGSVIVALDTYPIRDKCDVTVSILPSRVDSLCQKEFNSIKSDTILAVCFKNYRLLCWKNLGVYSYESMWYQYRKRKEKIRITTKVKEKEKAYLRNFFLRQLYKLPDSGIVALAYIVSDMIPKGVVVCRLNSYCWHYEIGSGSPQSQIEEWLRGK